MTNPEPLTVLSGGPTVEERDERLAGGAAQLTGDKDEHPILGNERFLLTVAGTVTAVGIVCIILGWLGVARSTLVEEQLPYVVSGGLLGVALCVIGALTFFSHWLTVLVRESRAREDARRQDHHELMEALRTLNQVLGPQEDGNGRARSTRSQRPVRRAPRSS